MENNPLDQNTPQEPTGQTQADTQAETPKGATGTKKQLPAFLVLGVIAIVAAVVLALTNLLTKGPIEEHAQKALREAFAKVLAAESYEPVEVDASYAISSLYTAKDGDTVKGYTVTAVDKGYAGDVAVTMGVDPDGTITGIVVGDNNFVETAGFGAKAQLPAFTDQFTGLDGVNGASFEAISGATITSTAVLNASNRALAAVAKVALGTEAVSPALSFGAATPKAAATTANADGSITATAAGFGGDVTVTVTADEDGTVKSLTVETPDETPGLGSKASEEDFVRQFIGKKAPFVVGDNIDVISGATVTTDAAVKAVNAALGAENTAEAAPVPTANADGSITATAAGFGGDVTVTVTADEDGTVTALTVDTPDETPGLGSKASEEDFVKQFIGKKAPFVVGDNIDVISGATVTTDAVVKAVNAALGAEDTAEAAPAPTANADGSITATAAGFGGDVTVTVTADEDGTVTALTVETPDETPGLGSKASEEDFVKQFIGKKAPFVVGENIDVISGATVTTDAVVKAVNAALGAEETAEAAPVATANADGSVTATAAGFGGDVTVTVTADADGTVTALTVDTPDETPGLGSKASEEDFVKQFIGKKAPFVVGDNIDVISGATVTTDAVVKAVNAALGAEDTAEAAPAPTANADGSITATAAGFGGDVTVTVTADADGTVTALTVETPDETPGLGSKASEEDFVRQFIGKKAPFAVGDNIDVISGATVTTDAVVKAVNAALGAEDTADAAPAPTEEPTAAPAAEPTAAPTEKSAADTPGTTAMVPVSKSAAALAFSGKAGGFAGDVEVSGTVLADGTVETLTVDASGETPSLGGKAMEEAFTSQFIGKKAPFAAGENIDVITGATITTDAVVKAVNEAVADALTQEVALCAAGVYEASAKGFASDVTATVTIGEQGMIQSVEADVSGETEGIGTRIGTEEDFLKQFVGLVPPIALGDGVDALSGATVTSTAVVDAVNAALQGEPISHKADTEDAADPATASTDDQAKDAAEDDAKAAAVEAAKQAVSTSFTSVKPGKMSDVTVTFTLDEEGAIATLEIDASGETPDLGGKTMEESFTSQFIGKKPPITLGKDVDAISGATVTSTAVVDAINNIYDMAAAMEHPTVPEGMVPNEDDAPMGFAAMQNGKNGPVYVYFTADENGIITSLRIDASGETPDLGGQTMKPDFIEQFIGKKLPVYAGYGVDTLSGATMTSSAVIQAINLVGRYAYNKVFQHEAATGTNLPAETNITRTIMAAAGFKSVVTVTYSLDEDGAIATLQVDAAGETEGLGTKVMEESFTSQFIGKKPPFQLGDGIDAVSGATVTSKAVVDLLSGNGSLPCAPYDEGPETAKSIYASTIGKNGPVYVNMDIAADGTVLALQVDARGETPGLGGQTMTDQFLMQFVGKKGPFTYGDGVDAISGATVTSDAVLHTINGVYEPVQEMKKDESP